MLDAGDIERLKREYARVPEVYDLVAQLDYHRRRAESAEARLAEKDNRYQLAIGSHCWKCGYPTHNTLMRFGIEQKSEG